MILNCSIESVSIDANRVIQMFPLSIWVSVSLGLSVP